MDSLLDEPVIEALNECEKQERAEYGKRLRAMPTFDVTSEMVYLQGELDLYGFESLQEHPDETLDFFGALVRGAQWKKDLCAAEIERRRKRNLLPMPGAIGLAPDLIQQLKASVDMVAIVEDAGVKLVKRGRQYWGLCPFHAEKNPSFAVHPDKALFFCYACRTGGDLITFLQKINGESFMATMKRLAALANFQLPAVGGRTEPSEQILCESGVTPVRSPGPDRSGSQHKPAEERHSPLACFPFTDAGNGEAFAYLHGQVVRYDYQRKRWLLWTGQRWQLDQAGEIERLAKQTARQRLEAAAEIDDIETRKRAASWAIQSENDSRRRAMLRAAQSESPIADSGENWDAHDWLVGCENGVVDLRSGELREAKPNDRMTMTTRLNYDPTAEAPRWSDFLKEVFGDPETIDFVQRAAEYSLSGDTSEQVIFVCHGGGANGKSKFLSALRSAFGDYAANIPFATLESSDRPGGTNDVASMVNRRLVTASETSKSARLNEGRVKALTGQDAITARFLYAEFFTFEPKAKIWIGVNCKPRVSDDSFGFWRRIRLIPFTRTFGPDEADLRLGDVLKAEADGILTWAVQGCLKWQAEGLTPPKCVQDATEAYRVESDPLANFFEERCVIAPNAQALASELYQAYLACCEEYGERKPMTANGFGRRLTERGFAKERDGSKRRVFYRGVGLLAANMTR